MTEHVPEIRRTFKVSHKKSKSPNWQVPKIGLEDVLEHPRGETRKERRKENTYSVYITENPRVVPSRTRELAQECGYPESRQKSYATFAWTVPKPRTH